jgi:hypothetical protein
MSHCFHIKQSTIVSEYIEQFCEILHQLLIHDPTLTASIITNCFIDGLKKEIRSVVMVHRPVSLDTVSSLALLQEALADSPSKEFKKLDSHNSTKKFSTYASKSSDGSR